MAGSSSNDARSRAQALSSLPDDYLKGELPGVTTLLGLAQKFQETGASVDEAKDYIDRAAAGAKAPARESTPDGLTAEEANRQAFNAVSWAQYFKELDPTTPGNQKEVIDTEKFLSSVPKVSGPLVPADLAAIAPYFLELERSFTADPHIQTTNDIQQRFTSDKPLLERNLHMLDPLPESAWRNVLIDRYVDFHKLHTALQPGYNHTKAPKLDLGDVVISSKQKSPAKRPVTTEIDWSRTFTTWSVAVGIVYPHRKVELFGYCLLMDQFFRDSHSNPALGIRY
ncbi:hypothetical protein V5O48_018745, partial [Marasmius crinis-equi]